MKKIMIDPGHGGRDPGAIGPNGVQEKVVVLAVSKKLADILTAAGAEVKLSRTSDVSLGPDLNSDLAARTKIANVWGADLFVSVHCNSAISNPQAGGTETYYYPSSVKGLLLANLIQGKLIAALGLNDRHIKQADFAVLRKTNCPAILAELAFISNITEESLLELEVFQQKAAQAIAEGVAEYLGLSLSDPIADAIKVLQDAGVISNPDYWLTNARPGKMVDGDFAGALIQKAAKKIKG